ncbi:unnamed protein product [Rotaria sp. Silwood2]|nr:unnamed protein product [Rotaria sp. Silwood2]
MTTITARTLAQTLPELSDADMEITDGSETEDLLDEDNDTDDDEVDYIATTIDTLPASAKIILDAIKDCKSLVKYVKKVRRLTLSLANTVSFVLRSILRDR